MLQNYPFQDFTITEVRASIHGHFVYSKGAHAVRIIKMDLNNTRRRTDSEGRTYQTIKGTAIMDGVRREFTAFWDCTTGDVYNAATA